MRVLVVEDEPDIAQFICQGLGKSGYAVDLATDGLLGLVAAGTTLRCCIRVKR